MEHCSGIKTPRKSSSLLTRKEPCELKNVGSSHILFLEFFFPRSAQEQTQLLRSGTATSVWAFKTPKGKEREKEWKGGKKEGSKKEGNEEKKGEKGKGKKKKTENIRKEGGREKKRKYPA